MVKQAMCLTFAESVENHVGNQQIGERSQTGWSYRKLKTLSKELIQSGVNCELVHLHSLLENEDVPESGVLVIRNCVQDVFGENTKELFEHLKTLDWDKHYWDTRRQKVLNKRARWNLCFANTHQNSNYESGQGTVYTFEEAKIQNMRKCIQLMMTDKRSSVIESLNAEGNYYYDMEKACGGIGMHGDTERKKVFGVNLGDTERYLVYQWYLKSERVGEKCVIQLNDGDCYIMSDKAVGHDWKKRSIHTLRHGAGLLNSNYIE